MLAELIDETSVQDLRSIDEIEREAAGNGDRFEEAGQSSDGSSYGKDEQLAELDAAEVEFNDDDAIAAEAPEGEGGAYARAAAGRFSCTALGG